MFSVDELRKYSQFYTKICLSRPMTKYRLAIEAPVQEQGDKITEYFDMAEKLLQVQISRNFEYEIGNILVLVER